MFFFIIFAPSTYIDVRFCYLLIERLIFYHE